MNRSVIVSGEASETESEDESTSICEPALLVTDQIKCQAVSGEDSESENENYDKSVVPSLSDTNPIDERKKTDRSSSLLHQKLRETNISFYNNLDTLIKNTVSETEKSLAEVDQQILKSQLIVQGAATSLKNLNIQSNALKNKLHTMLSSHFLSNVKVSE